MAEIVPTFLESSFDFGEDSEIIRFLKKVLHRKINEIPEHLEDFPEVPSYVGAFAIFGANTTDESYTLALDVPSELMARQLAEARKKQQEASIDLYGYTDDVYVLFPDGHKERTYYGHMLEE